MGLTAGPNIFQSLKEKALVGLTWRFGFPHLDDCIIFSRNIEEPLEHLRYFFQRFEDANLKINPIKYEFFRHQEPFLGHAEGCEGTKETLKNFNC